MHASRKRHSHLESDCSTSCEWIVTRGHSVGLIGEDLGMIIRLAPVPVMELD